MRRFHVFLDRQKKDGDGDIKRSLSLDLWKTKTPREKNPFYANTPNMCVIMQPDNTYSDHNVKEDELISIKIISMRFFHWLKKIYLMTRSQPITVNYKNNLDLFTGVFPRSGSAVCTCFAP